MANQPITSQKRRQHHALCAQQYHQQHVLAQLPAASAHSTPGARAISLSCGSLSLPMVSFSVSGCPSGRSERPPSQCRLLASPLRGPDILSGEFAASTPPRIKPSSSSVGRPALPAIPPAALSVAKRLCFRCIYIFWHSSK